MAKVEEQERKLRNLRRRVNRARNFSVNTDPYSRHLHEIADELLSGVCCQIQEEPRYCAETMLVVLEQLWKTRTELKKRKEKAA